MPLSPADLELLRSIPPIGIHPIEFTRPGTPPPTSPAASALPTASNPTSITSN